LTTDKKYGFYEEHEVIEYLKIDKLKPGYLYEIEARTAGHGIWIPQRESFLISRIKCNDNFLFEENHWDCESFGTARPIKEIEKSPFNANDINVVRTEKNGRRYMGYPNEEEILEYLNKFKE